jgi:hypothetical protein
VIVMTQTSSLYFHKLSTAGALARFAPCRLGEQRRGSHGFEECAAMHAASETRTEKLN